MSDSKIIFSKTIELTKSNSVTIQVSNYMGKDLLNIYKSSFSDKYTGIVKNNSIAFSYEDANSLLEIIHTIDDECSIKEYGQVGRYKVFISNFNGINSFQMREWIISDAYTGYGKKGVSIAIEKLNEFKSNFDIVLKEFDNYIKYGLQESKTEKSTSEDDIESYF